MTDRKPQSLRGHARVTFRANLTLIRTELEQGHTAKTIYERHAAKLGSMSYRQLLRYIEREITGLAFAPPARPHQPDPAPSPAPAAASKDSTLPTSTGKPTPDAGHEPAPTRRFDYDGTPRQDDADRLIGGSRRHTKE